MRNQDEVNDNYTTRRERYWYEFRGYEDGFGYYGSQKRRFGLSMPYGSLSADRPFDEERDSYFAYGGIEQPCKDTK